LFDCQQIGPTSASFIQKTDMNNNNIPLPMILSTFNKKHKTKKTDEKDGFVFSPEDIELKDDAFHKSTLLPFTEWWYFDAEFENGYSVQLGIRLISLLKRILAFSRLDIYKDGKLLSHKRKIHTMRNFKASTEVPLVKIAGKEIMNGQIKQGKWVYYLSFELDDTAANLRFIGNTKGWKGHVPGSNWGVILPRADVVGKIRIKGEGIDVKGTGYHDHNWNVTPDAVFNNFGWYWGKINSENFTIIWSNILKTESLSCPLLVINQKNQGYMNIDPKCISIIAEEMQEENRKKIPNGFTIDAKNDDISLHVDMEVLGIHHVKIMAIMKYWRYHVRCTGSIIFNSIKEKIDRMQMAEYLRFK